MQEQATAEIGIIGGSGLYHMTGFEKETTVALETPFGDPSDVIHVGELEGRKVAFLARHGKDHRLIPSEINYRANIYAMKTLGVERVVSASAVGSMREDLHPRDVVVPDQFIDRTRVRASTFFGNGIAAHVSFGDPLCPEVRKAVLHAAKSAGARVRDGGVYVCIEGPAFSTRAESLMYRAWGADVIGMTNLQEAKLAREAEICYATLALVTDYDCWHQEEQEVSVEALIENLRVNSGMAQQAIAHAVRTLGARGDACGCAHALRDAIITPLDAVSSETRKRLGPILAPYLK
ncbi:MAG: S-methyl-5'-thioadenosine phosphorylase [Acidobacteriota bacterium]|nr:S-methyl-5'-thioadenosine phosphorylase [Acidobacteriota bacterium]